MKRIAPGHYVTDDGRYHIQRGEDHAGRMVWNTFEGDPASVRSEWMQNFATKAEAANSLEATQAVQASDLSEEQREALLAISSAFHALEQWSDDERFLAYLEQNNDLLSMSVEDTAAGWGAAAHGEQA